MKFSKVFLSFILSVIFVFTGVTYDSIPADAANTSLSKMYFIDLHEKGNATIVESQSGSKKIYGLIDTGTSKSFKYVREKLNALGVTHLDFIILTHLDVDHAEGAPEAISAYADSNTRLYLKDTYSHLVSALKVYKDDLAVCKDRLDKKDYTSTEQKEILEKRAENLQKAINRTTNLSTRLSAIKKAASSKNVPIVNITPKALPTQKINSIDDIKKQANNIFQTNIAFTFGEYTIKIYNGYDWNNETVVGKYWDENVNAATVLLQCTASNGKIFTTYLGSDLGACSTNDYSSTIAQKTASALGKKVSLYQVAHHGYYYSMSKETAATLDFKYAIVTESYHTIADKGVAYAKKKDSTISDTTALSLATNTIKYLTSSASLRKIYFTGGSNNGGKSSYRIINALADPAKNYLNYSSSDIIKNGTITVSFGTESMSVIQ